MFCFVFFFFHCVYPLRLMQLLLFLHESLSFAYLSAVPHVSSIFLCLQRFFYRVIFGLSALLLKIICKLFILSYSYSNYRTNIKDQTCLLWAGICCERLNLPPSNLQIYTSPSLIYMNSYR